jgi:sulfane dehydrogenase subunit SoxC
VTGLAWSGRGAITKVDITVDGSRSWTTAVLQTPVLARAHAIPMVLAMGWAESLVASRCTDETGYVQPSLAELVAVRGVNSNYHNNAIQVWKVASDGKITNGNRA